MHLTKMARHMKDLFENLKTFLNDYQLHHLNLTPTHLDMELVIKVGRCSFSKKRMARYDPTAVVRGVILRRFPHSDFTI